MKESARSDSAADRLAAAFMSFRKAMRHPRTVAGRTPGEVHTLMVIHHATAHCAPDTPGLSVSEVSRAMRVTSPSITQMVNVLEGDGLVVRNTDPTDRRAIRLRLTPSGLVVAEQAGKEYHEMYRGLAEYLGEEQSDQLATLLARARQYFTERAGAAPEEELEGDLVP
ncbi:MAG TPA: MarR family transcriptional regulator [Ktedonobacterales bacterium]|jgi:DNA-binding MarR family transcriptional regulator